jgi:quinol-cytochrome oxidoreductase complex cytochrome b subunit
MTEMSNKKSAADYSPVITFVISYFFLQLFDNQEATNFVLASLFALIAFMVDIYYLKEDKYLSKENIRITNFYAGLLTIIFLIIFTAGILSWYRMVSISLRMGILIFSVVIYMAVIFRAIRIVIEINSKSEKKNK